MIKTPVGASPAATTSTVIVCPGRTTSPSTGEMIRKVVCAEAELVSAQITTQVLTTGVRLAARFVIILPPLGERKRLPRFGRDGRIRGNRRMRFRVHRSQ